MSTRTDRHNRSQAASSTIATATRSARLVRGLTTNPVNPISPLQRTRKSLAGQRSLYDEMQEDKLSSPESVPPQAGFCFADIPINSGTVGRLQRKMALSHPGDPGEREAERVAAQVMSMPEPTQQPVYPGSRRPVSKSGCEQGRLLTMCVQAGNSVQNAEPPGVREALAVPGLPLDPATRGFMEPRFGHDFSRVRVHSGAVAERSARELDALAYTVGHDVVFGKGTYAPGTAAGRRLLAHELTHVIQQAGIRHSIQRYQSGEHAQLGETQAELKADFAPFRYTVRKGERLSEIARKFGITVAELRDANKSKLKRWPAKDGSGRMVEGFNAGEVLSVPQHLNEFAKAAIKDKSAKFTVNGVVLDYGVGVAMPDLFKNAKQMATAPPQELRTLATLINRERSGGKPVSTAEWQKATHGRYIKLAEKNEAHFAPENAALVIPSAAGAKSANQRTEWEKYHDKALAASQSGDKDKALMLNSFADHFLTDAFAAGHLVNKRDVMELFKSHIKMNPKGTDFTRDSKKFFDEVAKKAFTGNVKSEFSKYETYKKWHHLFRPDINSVSRFSTLLQRIYQQRPDILANAVAKGIHDTLNTLPGGLPVENAKGDKWQLSGDGTLNAKTKEIARKAVAQSQLNVISVYKMTGPLDYTALYKKVWDYTPKPTSAGIKILKGVVKKGVDIHSAALINAVVTLIKVNYKLLIDGLVRLKKLRKA